MTLPYPTVGVVTDANLADNADVFPILPGQDFLVTKDPEFSTKVSRSSSGRSIRSAHWTYPIYHFKLRHNVIRSRAALPEFQKLLGFFNSRLGSFGSFFFWDSTDYSLTDEPMGTGDGATTTFQALRTVGRGTTWSRVEPVYAFWEQPVFKVNGVVTAGTVAAWGEVTFASPPANGHPITWTGKHLYVCCFEQDRMTLEQLALDLWSQDGLQFESIKP